MTAPVDLTPGAVVSLEHRWGNQVRQKCPACTKFFKGTVCHCGIVYRPVGTEVGIGMATVVSLP